MAVYDDQQQKTTDDELRSITGVSPQEKAAAEARASNDGSRPIGSASSTKLDRFSKDVDEDSDEESAESDQESGGAANGTGAVSAGSLQDKESTQDKKPNKLTNEIMGGPDGGGAGVKGALKSKVVKFFLSQIGAVVGVGAIGAIVMVILFMVLIFGFLKIPNFAENVVTWQMARVTRDMARNVQSVNATKLAIDSADDTAYGRLKQRYAESAGSVKDTWSKLDKYRPNKTIKNMQRDKKLVFEYSKGTIIRPYGRLTSVTIGDTKVEFKKPTLTSRLIPGVKFVNNISYSQQLARPLTHALAADDIGPIIRGAIGRKVRQQLGISLIAWNVGKYTGKTTEQSKIQVEQDSRNKIKGNRPVTNPKVPDVINEAAEKADQAEAAALNDPEKAKKIVQNPNELPDDVNKVLDDAFSVGTMERYSKSLLSFLNGAYAIAVPICIVYDGSLHNAGPTIDKQSDQAQRAFYMVASGSSQLKEGYHSSGNAAGALMWKLGDIEASNSEMRANGQTINTSSSFSTQASPTGQYSIFDALLPPPFDSLLNNAAQTCPLLTNVWAGIGIAAANIAVVIASFGSAGAAEGAANVAVNVTVRQVAKKIVDRVTLQGIKDTSKKALKDLVIQGGTTALATFIAKAIVTAQIGSQQSALSTGTTFANMADSGANQNAQQMERQALFARPCTRDEVAWNNVADQQFIAGKNADRSVFERYLSPSNPNSMMTHLASMTEQRVGSGRFTSLFNLGSSVLNPINAFGSATNSLATSRVGAASTDTSNYGNVQFCYSPTETAKLQLSQTTNLPTDESYELLSNRSILDDSDKENEIAETYGKCFDPATTIGVLLTEDTAGGDGDDKYYIVRDSAGNVDPDKGLCSPKNLSYNNPKYGDLVFRWRVDHAYSAALDQLSEIQSPVQTEDDGVAGSGDATGEVIDGPSKNGWVWPLPGVSSLGITPYGGTNSKGIHKGIDIGQPGGASLGKPVVAAHDGVVTMNTGNGEACGHYVVIKATGTNYYAAYQHLSDDGIKVRVGQPVKAGQVIGKVGRQGGSTCGTGGFFHLHFSIESGNHVSAYADPFPNGTVDPLSVVPRP